MPLCAHPRIIPVSVHMFACDEFKVLCHAIQQNIGQKTFVAFTNILWRIINYVAIGVHY